MFQSEFHHFDKCFTVLPNGSMMRFNPIGIKSTSTTNMYCIDRESDDDGSLVCWDNIQFKFRIYLFENIVKF